MGSKLFPLTPTLVFAYRKEPPERFCCLLCLENSNGAALISVAVFTNSKTLQREFRREEVGARGRGGAQLMSSALMLALSAVQPTCRLL